MARFDADFKGIGDMLCSPEMQANMKARADRVAARAEATAPYDPDSKDGTHYRDAFSVESGVTTGKTRRAYGSVVNSDDAAFQIEHGTSKTPKHRTLGRALDAAKD